MSNSSPINQDIKESKVRLIDSNGQQIGIVGIEQALLKAEEAGLDLVQMTGEGSPVVCKLMDYGKHTFDAKKTQSLRRKKQRRVTVKEVKFRMGTDKADYEVKLRNLRRFLFQGNKSKVTIRFRGREVIYKDFAMELLARIKEELNDIAQVEQEPLMEGRQMLMILAPIPGMSKVAEKAVKKAPDEADLSEQTSTDVGEA